MQVVVTALLKVENLKAIHNSFLVLAFAFVVVTALLKVEKTQTPLIYPDIYPGKYTDILNVLYQTNRQGL